MSNLNQKLPLAEKETQLTPFVEILPEEIPYDPYNEPLKFLEFCKQRLVENGIGLPTPEQQNALYEGIDLMVFCGFDAIELQRTKSFGERGETWGVEGTEFAQMAHDAENSNEWATHSTIGYAQNKQATTGVPAMAVFDGAKMNRIINGDDRTRHIDEFVVADGFTMDQAAIAVFYLPSE